MKKPPLTIIDRAITETSKNDPFIEVEIFLRVNGRLPTEKGDGLTQELLDEYCRKYEAGELKEGMVSLELIYYMIKGGKISIK
jgi:hypothetical protein